MSGDTTRPTQVSADPVQDLMELRSLILDMKHVDRQNDGHSSYPICGLFVIYLTALSVTQAI
jgi:hypothetical protein